MLAANKRKGQCLRTERQERFRYHLNVILICISFSPGADFAF